ncbi:hypothetical protein A3752_17225 [Oleiphilus sp. HI0081]|jgi:RNA polymerase sigma-70 factor (ECF subfamily)|uniref:sigma-70 family RNA polymerase sigma factor n=2 Tax=Oleiphilus TaxID=141450 RepID=UPI0007C3F6BE|nr:MULTISPECIES: sigma-70 family RNA polymerase sigma factor [unclassified Oleiphilus]KZY78187.1 hypothetical protein A3740_08375 [Oleiphilus sp. HI0068]KZY78864.1 hypothetical protein A3741_07810 [Oleiphilus sp. HI0069]KZZ07081.1 hypothetical protein A3749_02340 [Oleiphilus sp. HI0078]KZZ30303.1 hypothetical protein A3752_17225 [Oleiphilus sp. HI0081]KZZ44208.1 hypothetical protein A3755_03360 [Oleiphilus sp. HI0085]
MTLNSVETKHNHVALPANNDPDNEWVTQAQEELPYRTCAYEKLIRKYEKLVFHICLKMLGNRDDADDVSQEVMLKVFHSLVKFEGRSSFKTWIARIATNTCLSAADKRKRTRELQAMLTDDPSQERTSTINTTKRDLDSAMQLLAPKEREILTLRYTAELRIEEVAEVCDLKLSATKMRLYRAQEALKEHMKAYQH